MFRVPFISLALVLAVVACAKNDPVDPKAVHAAAALPDVKVLAPSAIGEPHRKTEPSRPLPASAMNIPAGLQGRWGLTPADCISTGRAARGLLLVTPNDLHFYESRAVPSAEVEADGDSIGGDFIFGGDGQSWTRYEALALEKDRLIRTETNPSASFTYAKCT